MKRRRHQMVAILTVVVVVGAGSSLLVSSTGGGANDAGRPRDAISTCDPPPARCGSEDNDLLMVLANEAARRALEGDTTATTTVTNVAP